MYKDYGQIPEIKPFLYGIKPAIIAIILSAIFPLAKKSLKSVQLALIGVLVLLLSLLKYNEIMLMFGAGIIALVLYFLKNNTNKSISVYIPLTLFQFSNTNLISVTNFNLFLVFLKIGAILYESGYVLFAFLDAELVATGLLTRTQLIDAIAVGQFTPGPVFSSVTFIGYQINDLSGALISTIAIFLPSFIFVALLNPLVKKMRNSNVFASFLDAVNVASIAIIISICLEMGKETIIDWKTILIAILSLIITFNYRKINSAFIVIGGSLIGYILHFV